MLLDSASECAEVSSKVCPHIAMDVMIAPIPIDEPSQQTRGQGLFAISSIQLFVYLIAPLAGDQDKPRRPSVVPPPKPPRTDQAVLDEKRRREREKQKKQEEKQHVPAENVETIQVSSAYV
ncbi:unnamed protein product [Angiostrongylus costaricensis]|uniref:PRP21_like_P domain-containing protein n=1 Tax=Angiostrongylus costaricensis TaxID=334426 RepID=A0A0R3PZ98_ANGCS|nr:unnamed protein product [Angiostrongylus costaricensis]